MLPVAVAAMLALVGRRRLIFISCEPRPDVIKIELLVPDHAGECLALHEARVGVVDFGLQLGIEFVGFADASVENGVEVDERFGGLNGHITRSRPAWRVPRAT